MRLGDKIPILLAQRGWQLSDLARRARIDIRTLFAMTQRHTRSSRFAPQIAQAFGITLEELLADAPVSPIGRVAEPQAHYGGLRVVDPLEVQLVDLYRGCSPARRDDLLRLANMWHNESNHAASPANPYPVIRPPAPAKKVTR